VESGHITRGIASLKKAEDLGGTLGMYALQATIASCHAKAISPEKTNWEQITAFYVALAEVAPSPVVELKRAIAVSMAMEQKLGWRLLILYFQLRC